VKNDSKVIKERFHWTSVSQMGGSNLPRPHLVIFYFFPSA